MIQRQPRDILVLLRTYSIRTYFQCKKMESTVLQKVHLTSFINFKFVVDHFKTLLKTRNYPIFFTYDARMKALTVLTFYVKPHFPPSPSSLNACYRTRLTHNNLNYRPHSNILSIYHLQPI